MSRLLAVLRHTGVRRLVAVGLDCLCTFLDEVAAEVYPESVDEEPAEPPGWYGHMAQ